MVHDGNLETMSGCRDHATQWPRFRRSNIPELMADAGHDIVWHGLPGCPDAYVYPTSTNMDPEYWAGWHGNQYGHSSLFDHIPAQVMDDMRRGRAALMIDQSREGYTCTELFAFMHAELDRLSLPGASLIYASGNAMENKRYLDWCAAKNIMPTICITTSWELAHSVRVVNRHQPLITWDAHQGHKSASNASRLYNCMNRIDRYHRDVMFMVLWEAGLLQDGFISKRDLPNHDRLIRDGGWVSDAIDMAKRCLPLRIDLPDFDTNVPPEGIPDIYLDTHVSVITETICDDEPDSVFISEKTWKAMLGLHPFMVLSNRWHLRRLRELGYETFSEIWDEGYDDLDDMHDRAKAIAAQLRMLAAMDDIGARMAVVRDVVEHNQRYFISRSPGGDELGSIMRALGAIGIGDGKR